MTVATAPTITAGRVFLDNGAQQEWIRFTGVSGSVLTGLTRNLSKTADPITGGTGLQWIAGTQIKIVAMHDQLWDKSTFLGEEHTYTAKQTFDDIEVTGTADFSAIGDLNVLGKSNPCPVVASELARDAMYPSPATNDRVYRTDLNAEQIYNGGTAAWETVGIGTSVVDASDTVKGMVQLGKAATGADI